MRCDATDGHGRNHTTQQRVSQPRCGLSPPLLRPLATFNYAEMYTLAAGSRLTGALLLSGGGALCMVQTDDRLAAWPGYNWDG